MTCKIANYLLGSLTVISSFPVAAQAGPITIFSGSGFNIPDNITPIPAGFRTVGGNHFFRMRAPTSAFVPAGYGALSGQFLVSGAVNAAGTAGLLLAVDSTGAVTPIAAGFTDLADTVAPAGFGSAGGKVLFANNDGGLTTDILTLNTDESMSVFATLPLASPENAVLPLGLGFAPANFGSIGGDLLVTDITWGNIDAVDSSGDVSLFATLATPLPLPNNATGLSDFAFAPEGFGQYGGGLFVSVDGNQGDGHVDVLDGSGAVVAELEQGTVGAPFNPSGLYFTSDDQLLIGDADPGILSATPAAFTACQSRRASACCWLALLQ